MDTFIEQIVGIKNTTSKTLLKISMWFSGAGLAFVAFLLINSVPYIGFLGIFVGMAILFGVYKMTSSMNIEYEYSITNGSFDIDRIIARRKRKRIITAQCKDFESFGKYIPEKHANTTYTNKLIAANLDSKDLWYGVMNTNQYGTTLIVLEPSEKTLAGLKKYLPPLVSRDAFSGY